MKIFGRTNVGNGTSELKCKLKLQNHYLQPVSVQENLA